MKRKQEVSLKIQNGRHENRSRLTCSLCAQKTCIHRHTGKPYAYEHVASTKSVYLCGKNQNSDNGLQDEEYVCFKFVSHAHSALCSCATFSCSDLPVFSIAITVLVYDTKPTSAETNFLFIYTNRSVVLCIFFVAITNSIFVQRITPNYPHSSNRLAKSGYCNEVNFARREFYWKESAVFRAFVEINNNLVQSFISLNECTKWTTIFESINGLIEVEWVK